MTFDARNIHPLATPMCDERDAVVVALATKEGEEGGIARESIVEYL